MNKSIEQSNTCLHPIEKWAHYRTTAYCSVCGKKVFGLKLRSVLELIGMGAVSVTFFGVFMYSMYYFAKGMGWI